MAKGLPTEAWTAATLRLFALLLPVTIAGANIAWGLTAATLAARWLRGEDLQLAAGAGGALERPLWTFIAAAALASCLGVDPARSFRFLYQDLHKLWLYYLLSAALAAGATAALAPAMAAAFALASALGIFQFLSTLSAEAQDRLRAHAFVHPVTFGEQACLAVLGAACFLLRPPAGLKPRGARRWVWAAGALFFAALLLSNTRGALLGLGAGALAVAMALGLDAKRLLLVLGSSAALLVAGDLSRLDRSILRELLLCSTTARPGGEQMQRLVLWKAAWLMGADHPWTGVGPANYRQEFPRYFSTVLEGGARTWGTAHDLYLHHFAERGLIGLAALGWLLWALCARAWRRARRLPDAWNLWALGTTAAFLAMNLTEVALQTEILWMAVLFIWLRAENGHRREVGAV